MALRGNLRDFSLPDVFQLVTLSRKTGVLRIKRADAEGSVWFRDGEVFFAQSDWRQDPLGTRLVSAGRITPAALGRALDIQRSDAAAGRRMGQILVDEGYITEKVLEAFVQEQIQDTIFDLFRWEEGDFDFEPLGEAPEEDIGLSVSIENIVMEGSRRLDEWNRIKKKIPSMEIVFKMATAPGEGTFDISLKPAEWNLLLRVDGTRSVSELAHDLGRTDFEVARVIYGLFSAGLLEVATDEEVERLRAERIEMEAVAAADVARKKAPAADKAPAPEKAAKPTAETAEAAAPPEEPAFLTAAQGAASKEDMAVFAEMVGAVLESPAATAPAEPAAPKPQPPAAVEEPAAPEAAAPAPEPVVEEVPATPGELSDLLSALEPEEPAAPAPKPAAVSPYIVEELPEEAPAAPAAPAPAASEAPALTGDFATDLLAMGLGELPAEDLLAPVTEETPAQQTTPTEEEAPVEVAPPEPEVLIVDETVAIAEELPAIEIVPGGVEEPEEEPVAGIAAGESTEDLAALLSSLGSDEPQETVVIDTSSVGLDVERPADVTMISSEEEAPAGGVISTDAFLADFSGGDASFSSALGDELTALTGGGRARPQASVSRPLPEPGEPKSGLHRDQHVDRELVEKIIEGVKNL